MNLDNMNLGNTAINELTLTSAKEAEIATEYGDGTEFKEGDTVLHNHEAGTYAQKKSEGK